MEIKDNFYISFLLGIIVAILIITAVNSVFIYESNKKIEKIYSILDTNTTCEDIIPNK